MAARLPHLLAVSLLALNWLFATPADAACRPPDELARVLVDNGASGELELSARFFLDEDALLEGRPLRSAVEIHLPRDGIRTLGRASPTLCVSLVVEADGELLGIYHRRVEVDLEGATGWIYQLETDLPDGTSQVLVVVQDASGGAFGIAAADPAEDGLMPRGPAAVQLTATREAPSASWHQTLPGTSPSPGRRGQRADPVVIRLIPPPEQPVGGNTRFDALVSSDAVERVVFRLDGEDLEERRRRPLLERPFVARLPLARPPRPQIVEAVAYDRHGREIGRDQIEVNRIDAPFRVRITELEGDLRSGEMTLEARVSVPADARLERVEVYRGERLLGTYRTSEIRQQISVAGASPDEFLRVAAFLSDGSSIDDVVLLGAGASDEVDVNLVGLQAVVTDASGRPVEDLRQEDFSIQFEGRSFAPQSFAYADDVSLLLGLVVDTSGSMQLVMHDTQRAAAKFLGTAVLPQDRAFLVDFDQRPRLLHPTTSDLPRLLLDLSRLRAEGTTAMYDAVMFSMLQFEREPGRKALVVLTDGDDRDSRFGPKDCIELARKTGVPVYIIGLGALDTLRRILPEKELRRVTEQTGGRLYLVDSIAELDGAYAQIQAELRSQYSLAFYADRDLNGEERRQIRLEIARPGLEARTVVGDQSPTP